MVRKLLQVEKTPMITSECWSYYKFAVMQTTNYFDMWLASHMNIYMQNDSVIFGEGSRYPLSYYGEILEISEQGIHLVSEKEISQFLIDQIDNGYYIILDMNINKLYDSASMDFRMHETLIYGYDTKCKRFLTPLLLNGTFKEKSVSFESVEDSYKDILNYYRQNVGRLFSRRDWFAPITLIKPKYNYDNMNVYYDFITKLKLELDGNIHTVYKGIKDSRDKKTSVIYMGLSIVQRLAQILQQEALCSVEEIQKNYQRNYLGCLKLYEHQNIICRSMQWFLDTIDNDCEKLQVLVEKYGLCCEKLRLNVSLIQKFYFTKDSQLLLRIADTLEEILPVEQEILEEFVKTAPEVYIRKRLIG